MRPVLRWVAQGGGVSCAGSLLAPTGPGGFLLLAFFWGVAGCCSWSSCGLHFCTTALNTASQAVGQRCVHVAPRAVVFFCPASEGVMCSRRADMAPDCDQEKSNQRCWRVQSSRAYSQGRGVVAGAIACRELSGFFSVADWGARLSAVCRRHAAVCIALCMQGAGLLCGWQAPVVHPM